MGNHAPNHPWLRLASSASFRIFAPMIRYPIPIGEAALPALQQLLAEKDYAALFVLTDTHTREACYPRLAPQLPPHQVFTVQVGEQAKHLGTCSEIWAEMTRLQLDRHAVVLNLGGGVIGDMGGFVAGTYKRGIDFIQIPTTLLAMVDASVGGKLGVDFQGYKNHIGLFAEPQAVIIWPEFLETLPLRELRSGFAEVLKHHLIADGKGWETLAACPPLEELDFPALIAHSVAVKRRIVDQDPQEQGPRKALNFGHTLGHAVESHFLESVSPLLHGEAIAIGMIGEAWLSAQRGALSEAELASVVDTLRHYYPFRALPEAEFAAIAARARNDKKNRGGRILCSLLEGLGHFRVNVEVTEAELQAALAFYLSTASSLA
jgi:3-dehydroquinate synthase